MDTIKPRKSFLSYSRVNKDFAVRLARELKSEGFNVWLDQLDIPAGARWDREVERALKESEIFMIILTSASVESENVLDEIGYAIDTGKRLLPVLLEKCDVPFRLRRFQYVDFTNKDFDDGVESAKELLRSLIEQPTIPKTDGAVIQAEAEQPAVQKARQERQAKGEADRLAAQKKEEERLAEQKANSIQIQPTGTITAIPSHKTASKGMIFGVTAVVVLIVAAIGFSAILKNGNQNSPVISGPTSKPIPTTTAHAASSPTAKATCPYQGSSDTETFKNLVHAEAKANLDENINIIGKIFTNDAIVRENGESYSPISYYLSAFQNQDFIELYHYDFIVVKQTSTQAWMKVSDDGKLILTSTGEQITYKGADNPGAGHIIFQKDSSGCWLIAQFSLDASGESFP